MNLLYWEKRKTEFDRMTLEWPWKDFWMTWFWFEAVVHESNSWVRLQGLAARPIYGKFIQSSIFEFLRFLESSCPEYWNIGNILDAFSRNRSVSRPRKLKFRGKKSRWVFQDLPTRVNFLTVTVRDDYNPHGTRWQCTAKKFIMALSMLVG